MEYELTTISQTRRIQDTIGSDDLKITEIYDHVSTQGGRRRKFPFEDVSFNSDRKIILDTFKIKHSKVGGIG